MGFVACNYEPGHPDRVFYPDAVMIGGASGTAPASTVTVGDAADLERHTSDTSKAACRHGPVLRRDPDDAGCSQPQTRVARAVKGLGYGVCWAESSIRARASTPAYA